LVVNVKSVTGQWDISKKTLTLHLLSEGGGEGHDSGTVALVQKTVKVAHPFIFFLLVLGLVIRKSVARDQSTELYVLSCVLVYLLVIWIIGWASQRYLFVPVLLAYVWAGAGAVEVQGLVRRRFPLPSVRIVAGFSVLMFVVFLPVLLQPQRGERLGLKAIGHWIRQREVRMPTVMTDDPRVAYYAGARVIDITNGDYVVQFEPETKGVIDYIVVKRKNVARVYPELLELAGDDFSPLAVPGLSEEDEKRYVVLTRR
jgi:hypothetical protein